MARHNCFLDLGLLSYKYNFQVFDFVSKLTHLAQVNQNDMNHENTSTEKPRFNKSERTKGFVLYSRDFAIAGFFTIKLTTEGLKAKFFIAVILLLKGPLYRGFSVH
jgi:hypothetical protein